MASRLVAAAAASSSSTSSCHLARIISRRGLASGADHPGLEKVNLWEDPMSPMKWKHGHFVIAAVSIWGAFTYGGFKLFYEKKEIKTEVMVPSK
ncbi:hypothetical protein QOZ80_4BG0335140 [Eleusine coracana subsp. coracana]|nr:hypothetical protein QOZ80_4BG0335140 [Eleusine coracana subsp. coracana]